jgi:hypothetical protein
MFVLSIYFLNKKEEKNKEHMSFREAMDLTNLPIVTFYQGNNKFNFLLDTGSTLSVINKDSLSSMIHHKSNKTGDLFGVDGVKREVSYASINLVYKEHTYKEEFQVLDMQEAINQIKADSGVNMIGIIGSEFFRKYKYILDFNELIAYSKK